MADGKIMAAVFGEAIAAFTGIGFVSTKRIGEQPVKSKVQFAPRAEIAI